MICFRSLSFPLSLLTAGLLYLSYPGGGEWWPAVFVSLVPLLAAGCTEQKTSLHAFGAGLTCGIIHFMLLLYWLVTVLNQYGGLPWFLAWPGLFFLSLYMALYLALFVGIGRYLIRGYPPLVALLLLPALWVGIDWFRGFFLTGFPWMDLGYVLYRVPEMIQIADLVGHHGITYLIVLINCACFLFFTRTSLSQKLGLIVIPLLLLGGTGYYSKARYAEQQSLQQTGVLLQAKIGIVQGNVDQADKWSPEYQQNTVDTYIEASSSLQKNDGPLEFIVWPETALPFYPQNSIHIEAVRKVAVDLKAGILTGAPWYEIVDLTAKKVKYYNSAFLLNRDGELVSTYFKTHLVPFGEYVPLQKYLPFISPLVEAVGDFSPGEISQPLVMGSVKAGILICFESVFPELSRLWVLSGANVLVNLTNDAWYGKSSAPYHSLAMSVFRAVETRRAVVRSANTGVSAFISPSGKIESQSDIFVPWAAAEYVFLLEEKTFWVRFGYRFAPFCFCFALVAICGIFARRNLRNVFR